MVEAILLKCLAQGHKSELAGLSFFTLYCFKAERQAGKLWIPTV